MRANLPRIVLLSVFAIGAVLALAGSGGTQLRPRATAEVELFGDGATFLEITADEEAVCSLRTAPRTRVAARVRLPSGPELAVRIRLKGHGSFRSVDDKPSITVDFDSPLPAVPARIHLNNSVEDSTFAQEKIGAEICGLAGLAAPRVGRARVKLNGRDLGIYVLKEGVTDGFLAQRFRSKGTEKAEDDFAVRSVLAPNTEGITSRWQRLESSIAVDDLLSLMAAEVLMGHWDGYATGGHNIRTFRSNLDRKYHFLATGMDQLFGNARFPICPDMTGAVARELMEFPEARLRYQTRMRELSEKFDGRYWARRARHLAEALGPALSFAERRQLDRSIDELCERIVERDRCLDQELRINTLAELK